MPGLDIPTCPPCSDSPEPNMWPAPHFTSSKRPVRPKFTPGEGLGLNFKSALGSLQVEWHLCSGHSRSGVDRVDSGWDTPCADLTCTTMSSSRCENSSRIKYLAVRVFNMFQIFTEHIFSQFSDILRQASRTSISEKFTEYSLYYCYA